MDFHSGFTHDQSFRGFQFLAGKSNTMKTGVIASLLGILCSILESRKSDSSVDGLLKAM